MATTKREGASTFPTATHEHVLVVERRDRPNADALDLLRPQGFPNGIDAQLGEAILEVATTMSVGLAGSRHAVLATRTVFFSPRFPVA